MEEANKKELPSSGTSISSLALEHLTYKNIPGTNNSYRLDSGSTNSKTKKHAHIYARRAGGGKELYSVNIDGSGHDGYSGAKIPKKHAEYLKSIGFNIPLNLTLESIAVDKLSDSLFEFFSIKDIEKEIQKPVWTKW